MYIGKWLEVEIIKLVTFVLGARPAMRAAAALPALFSSIKLMVELMSSKHTIPTKSCQSGGLPPPFAKAIAISAAASITHDNGFHMNPKNFSNLLSCVLSNHNIKRVLQKYIYIYIIRRRRNLLLFELVGTKEVETVGSFICRKTLFCTFQLLEHFLHGYSNLDPSFMLLFLSALNLF